MNIRQSLLESFRSVCLARVVGGVRKERTHNLSVARRDGGKKVSGVRKRGQDIEAGSYRAKEIVSRVLKETRDLKCGLLGYQTHQLLGAETRAL